MSDTGSLMTVSGAETSSSRTWTAKYDVWIDQSETGGNLWMVSDFFFSSFIVAFKDFKIDMIVRCGECIISSRHFQFVYVLCASDVWNSNKYVKGVRQKKRRKVFFKVSACSERLFVSILGAGAGAAIYSEEEIHSGCYKKERDALRKKKLLHSWIPCLDTSQGKWKFTFGSKMGYFAY